MRDQFNDFHSQLYKRGTGFDHPVYKGYKENQVGGGLGSILSSVARTLIPIFKRVVLPNLKRGAITAVKSIVKTKRQPLKRVIKKNLVETGENILASLAQQVTRKRKAPKQKKRIVRKIKQVKYS